MGDGSLAFEAVTDRELVERDDVLDSLSGLLDEAAHQGGRLVLLAGEAGIGKTSVVGELIRRAGHGNLVLMGACDPLDTPRPLSPLLDIAGDRSSGISDLVAGGVTGHELFAALVDRLTGTARPTLLVIEDVHWADAATLDLLRFLGRRVERTNAVVVVTYRDDELALHEELRRLLGDLATRTHVVVRIALQPLTIDGVAVLVTRSGASDLMATSLHASTGGNPFYVTEVLASEGGLPATVQDAVLARLLRLDPTVRDVVEAVAVAPRSLDPADLDAMIAGGAVAADQADRRRGVGAGGFRVAFSARAGQERRREIIGASPSRRSAPSHGESPGRPGIERPSPHRPPRHRRW